MRVTDEQMALLRAYLAGQAEQAERARVLVARSGDVEGAAALVYAAFAIMTRRKFSPTWTRAEVIRFTGQVRALLSDQPDLLDPLAAGHQLRGALGEKLTVYPGEEAKARAQVVLLDALVHDADLDDAAIIDLLSQARDLAHRLPVNSG